MKVEKENQEILDNFANSALQSLISKAPLLDVTGNFGKQITEDDLQKFKKDLTETAYEYAEWMMIARKKSKEWINENKEVL